MPQDPAQTFRPTFLACFPKHFGPSQEESAVEEAESLLTALGVRAQWQTSGDWFKQSFPQHGNWDSWIWDTVHGKDYMTRAVRFHGFLVYGKEIGRATANIVKTALQSGRVVLALVDSSLYAVTDVEEQDSTRWSNGWTLVLSTIGD